MSIFDSLWPNTCLLCGMASGTAAVCPGCLSDLPRLATPRCPICATPLCVPAPACGACLSHPPTYDATHAAWRYGYPLDALIHLLKFGHGQALRRFASADFLASQMRVDAPGDATLLIPVPLSHQRLRERGFNQALELARPLANILKLPLDATSLTRERDTPPQSLLPWRARKNNVRHAFSCSTDFSGQSVIVVDDVMTTGATLDAIARILKDHGATRVTNWVAARAVKADAT
ncbi:MAG: ComF family protein [Rhodocyclaceae bacterium]|nr:ComF family protein [Rhodocyclaceae bacterium]MDZ4215033.1 ComF family protein [Rhodocyclaceae bacterium]